MWSLNRRVPRNLRANCQRWIPMLLLFAVCIYIIVSLIGFADVVDDNVDRYYIETQVEDGDFSTFVKLDDNSIKEINEMGFTIEPSFYIDYPFEESKRLRVFKIRKSLNLFYTEEGKMPDNDNEIAIEKNYAKANNIKVRDVITVCGIDFTVSGIGCTPDYEQMLQTISESVQSKGEFGTAYVNANSYSKLKQTGKGLCTEEYLYAFKKNDETIDSKVLKDYICDLKFNTSSVEDKYFVEMLDEVLADKIEFENSITTLSDTTQELHDVAVEFENGSKELNDACTDFCDGVDQLLDGINKIDEGVNKIHDNSHLLVSGADQVFDFFIIDAHSQLKQNGIDADITRKNYKERLYAIDVKEISSDLSSRITELRDSLEAVEAFYNGIVDYTSGVDELSVSSSDIKKALHQLSEAGALFSTSIERINPSDDNAEAMIILEGIRNNLQGLNQGIQETEYGFNKFSDGLNAVSGNSANIDYAASTLFNMLLTTASRQLSDNGINVQLTRDNYAYQLDMIMNEDMSKFDNSVKEMLNELSTAISEYEVFYNGLVEYTNAVSELKEGINEIEEKTSEIEEYTNKLKDASNDFVSYAVDFREGVEELSSEVSKFQENMDVIDQYFKIDIDNLTTFMNTDDNPRIQDIKSVTERSMIEGIICGIVIIILLVYVLSIFVMQEISQESAVIGALYSMGVKRKELLLHYVSIPMIISCLGGILGTILGYSKLGVDFQIKDSLSYYSLPEIKKEINPFIVLLSILVPPIIAYIVSTISIYCKLSKSPLSLLRKEQKTTKIKIINFEKLGFINNFRLKQIVNESKTSVAVFVGMFLPMILVILSINYFVCVKNLKTDISGQISFNNVYALKYAPSEVPKNGYEAYTESLTVDYMGLELKVSLIGVKPDNPFFNIKEKANAITIGTGTAKKLGLKTGDSITLFNSENDRYYTFRIEGEIEYDLGLTAFIDIDDMRELFGQDENFYNTIYSDKELSIDRGRLYSVVTKDKINRMIEDFCGSLGAVVYMLVISAILIYVVVTFLMIKLMIDRASLNISMMKIFGFHSNEIRKLYLDGNFITILISALISIPTAKIFVDRFWFPIMNMNIEYGFEVKYSFLVYVVIFAVIMSLYFIISYVLRRRINSISMVEILKCRE